MHIEKEISDALTRRAFLGSNTLGLGAIALGSLVNGDALAKEPARNSIGGLADLPHFVPKAKRVIYLFQSGGPSQMDLYDYKPELARLTGKELPDEVRKGQRLTAMSGNQASLPLVGSPFQFKQYGESGAWLSEVLPHTSAEKKLA